MVVLYLICTLAQSQSVAGKWLTSNEATGAPLSIIHIALVNGSIEGKVEKIYEQPNEGTNPICTKCTGVKKDKKVIGMEFLWGFKESNRQWVDGKILDPQSGEIYESKIWMQDNNTLKVRGYGGPMYLFYRTQTWLRDPLPSQTNTPVGIWQTVDDTWNKVKSIVKLEVQNEKLTGRIEKIFLMPNEGDDPICTECNGMLKNKKIVGMVILSDFRNENGEWVGGQIMDPANGSTYKSRLWLVDKNTLKVLGYLGPFYRSQIWRRAVE